MHEGIIFAVITAFIFALWTAFHQQASAHVNYLFGAIIVSLTAVVVGTILLLPKLQTTTLFTDPKGVFFVILAGICAFGIDYFALKAYGSGMQVSIVGPIIIGGSIAIASIIGFLLGESISLMKILGILFVIAGAAILATFGG